MPTRLPALRRPPIAFAHRGARAHAPENTLPAFTLAQKLGASGLESDVWLTADGVAVLDHDGVVGRVRRTPISRLSHAELPDSIPSLAQLYETCGSSYELSLDLKDPAAIDAVVRAAQDASSEASSRLWICHPEMDVLRPIRERWADVRLVHSTRMKRLTGGPERHAADLAASGIDAINLHHTEWSGGNAALYHRFDRLAFAWDVQFERIMDELLDSGLDALYSDHVDVLVASVAKVA